MPKLSKKALEKLPVKIYNNGNAPFLWAYFGKKNSWQIFDDLLKNAHIVTTPGSGFGQSGNGFIRFSAFGHRHDIEKASEALSKVHL